MTRVQIDCKDSGVPNQPKTPNTVVRLAPELREPLEREAQERGLYLSDVIREACKEHIERRDRATITRVLDAIRDLGDSLSKDARGQLLAAVYIDPDRGFSEADVRRGQEIWAELQGMGGTGDE